MIEKLDRCPECAEELRQVGYDFQYCWICGWGVKERGPWAADTHDELKKRIDTIEKRLGMPVRDGHPIWQPHDPIGGMLDNDKSISKTYKMDTHR